MLFRSYTAPTFADNCDGTGAATYVSGPTSSTSLNVSSTPYTVVYTYTDLAENAVLTDCSFTVTVQDDTPPTLVNCPPNITLKTSDDGGADCKVTLTYTAPTSADNCDGPGTATHSSGPTSGTPLDVSGLPYTVVYTKTDAASNTALTDCSFTVTVQDDTKPTITCPSAMTVPTAPDNCSTPPVTYNVTTTDNCSSSTATLVSGGASGSVFPLGVNTVVWKATDPGGNSTTCAFTVTVGDAQNPSIVCPGNISKNTDPNLCTAITTYAAPTVSDNCTGWTLTRTGGLASGSAFPKGVNMVTWQVSDVGGNVAICQFTVTVSDAQKPNLTCPANIVRSADAGQCYAVVTYTTPTATDNCGTATVTHTSAANTASGSQFPAGATTSVTWQASDNATPSPNVTSCTFTIKVNDTQAPTIACPTNQTKSTDAGLCTAVTTYTSPSMTDNCAGGSVTMASGLASGQPFPKGQTTVQWKATDGAGLTKTCTFRVTVNDTQAPTVACPSSQSLNTDANLCTAAATYTNATFTDNCTGGSVVRTSGIASGSAFPKGVSTVVFKATDAAGLTKTCSFTITVTDAQLPSITCPANIAVTAAPGQCNATVTYAAPTATDNCAAPSTSLLSGLGSGSLFPQGVTTVVWQAVDNGGLSATCAFTVTVACGTSASQPPRWGGAVTAERNVVSDVASGRVGPPVGLILSPNPAATEVTIFVENLGETGGDLTVLDAQGRRVWRQQLNNSTTHQLSVADFATGVYFVTLRSDGSTVTKRLVVTK